MNKCPGLPGESAGYLSVEPWRVVVANSDRKRVDTTAGTVAPKLLTLAWPLVLGTLLRTVCDLAGLFWVGRVNSESVAAVSLTFPLTYLFISTAMGLSAATIALVSQKSVPATTDRQTASLDRRSCWRWPRSAGCSGRIFSAYRRGGRSVRRRARVHRGGLLRAAAAVLFFAFRGSLQAPATPEPRCG